jgi:hypothetical protein
VSGLLLKIPAFSNYKAIVKDLDPEVVSFKNLKKSFPAIKNQCPNLI